MRIIFLPFVPKFTIIAVMNYPLSFPLNTYVSMPPFCCGGVMRTVIGIAIYLSIHVQVIFSKCQTIIITLETYTHILRLSI